MRATQEITMNLRCDNCGRTYADESELACVYPAIPDLLARIEPGGTVPYGECPNCGCLVYEEPEPEMPRCLVCGDRVDVNGFRDHLESHHPNAAGMDWEDVQAQFIQDTTDERPAMAPRQPNRPNGRSPTRVVIVLEGALVQQVLAGAPGCTYAVVDRDTEGVEPDRLRLDPADQRLCTIETGDAEADPEYVAAVSGAVGIATLPHGSAPTP
jgi:hypothetical protein